MSLETQFPLRVCQTIIDGHLSIRVAMRPVHWLQVPVLKVARQELFGHRAELGIDEFQFISGSLNPFGTRFGTHTQPVDIGECRSSSVGFDGHFKAPFVECVQQCSIELQ